MQRACSAIARPLSVLAACTLASALVSCGGGAGSTGSESTSGVNKTYLSVAASDSDGDTLHYQWRVTSGSIENHDSNETVWTMPDGPGLHFAYVTVSDGKGGWAEQQYAVASDTLGTTAAQPAPVSHAAPAVVDVVGAQMRLRFVDPNATLFQPPAGGAALSRIVYMPDVQVQVVTQATGSVVFAGRTDLSGELDLPKLTNGTAYSVLCSTVDDAPLVACGSIVGDDVASVRNVSPAIGGARNLLLHGHVALADGAVCGNQNAFFSIETAASVQVELADGTVLGAPVRVNRFGDYALDAAVPANGALKLSVQCEGYAAKIDVPASPDPAGYVGGASIELSHAIANNRPQIIKMVAAGADGNVRGKMIVDETPNAASNAYPGADHYLTYKGKDTKLGACMYYRALGAALDCDAQGNMIQPISFDDWKALNGFDTSTTSVSANYINQRDLNLVRRMVATRSGANGIAFYVCNAPGPVGTTQKEIDDVIETALNGDKRVACVAMEYTPVTGANGGLPMTKFFTFSPTGALLLSINLDGRGEKFMPGSCVACHGGTTYNGGFPEQAGASPNLGARFLPFDTGNYLFSSTASLGEAAQGDAFFQLNQLVAATEVDPNSATSNLIAGWYASGARQLDKAYVPPAWLAEEAAAPGAAKFYRGVIGTSCRTCHVSLGASFDWDSIILRPTSIVTTRVCGGKADVAINATMPNALISGDRLAERVRSDPELAGLMMNYLGCSTPSPDPVYPKR